MEIQNERRLVLPPLKFLHLRNMLIISIVLISGAIAARFALNSFQEPEPMLITPGWQLANELTTTLKRQPDTLVTSGFLFTRPGCCFIQSYFTKQCTQCAYMGCAKFTNVFC